MLGKLVLKQLLEESDLGSIILKAPFVWTMRCVQESIRLWDVLKEERERSEVCFVQLVRAYQPSFLLFPTLSPFKHIRTGTHTEIILN